jgi:DNA-binding NtrC family response regulator
MRRGGKPRLVSLDLGRIKAQIEGTIDRWQVPVGKKILVIDDEEMNLDAMRVVLEDMGLAVSTDSDPVKGTEDALAEDFDLVLTDIRMPGRNGAEVVEALLARKPAARVLVISAYSSDPLVERALKAGALGFLEKPFEIAKILDFLE